MSSSTLSLNNGKFVIMVIATKGRKLVTMVIATKGRKLVTMVIASLFSRSHPKDWERGMVTLTKFLVCAT